MAVIKDSEIQGQLLRGQEFEMLLIIFSQVRRSAQGRAHLRNFHQGSAVQVDMSRRRRRLVSLSLLATLVIVLAPGEGARIVED